MPGIPIFFGFLKANSEVIGVLAALAQIAHVAGPVLGAYFVYLGYRKLQEASAAEGVQQAVDVAPGGRGAAVGGDVSGGAAVVVGDHNRVEVSENVIHNYADVVPSAVDADTLERARQQLEALPVQVVPDRAALPHGSVMPLRRNRHFVGRKQQLKRIAENFRAGDTTTTREVPVVAISGLGGVGKTQLASEFVHCHGQYFYGVYWLSFANPDGVPAEVASCGGTKGMNLRLNFHKLPLEERIRAVMSEWQSELPRLLIFDNCEDENLLNQWLPPSGGCRVLVTSRRGSWDPALGVTDLPLDVLDRQESVALLREYRSDLHADDPQLHAIAEELGDLALALDLAGRYLSKYRREVTPVAYLEDIRRPDLLEHPSLRRAGGISPTEHDMNVWRTFAVSYRRLEPDDETDQTAVMLLARAARLAPGTPISDGLLAWALEPSNEDPPRPTTTVRDALDRLADLGLLENLGGEAFRMHRLLVAFALDEVPDDGARAALEEACARAAGRASRGGQPARLEALLPHLRFVTDSVEGRVDAMAANLCTALNASLSHLRAYDEALPYAERAWEISVELYGPNNRATLQRRSNIGEVFEGKGDRVQARAIYEEVVEAQEHSLGREDLDVAATLNNLGASLSRDDLYHEVLPRYRRALRIRKDAWEKTGPNDRNRRENAYRVAESYGNMGALMLDLGRYGEAIPCLTSAVQILGDEVDLAHERNAGGLIILGRALRAGEDYPSAAALLRSALAIYQNISASPPPVAASALANLGAVLGEWVKRDEALPVPQRAHFLQESVNCLSIALNGVEQMYGEKDPFTGGVLRALAGVCDAQGYTEDARSYRERADASRRANFEADKVSASALDRHGTSLMNHGLYDEAQAYLERALRLREDTPREQRFDISTNLLRLGVLFQLQGRDADARPYLERARDIRVELCGEDHPATELLRENIALLND